MSMTVLKAFALAISLMALTLAARELTSFLPG
jgi:hypothetical protein